MSFIIFIAVIASFTQLVEMAVESFPRALQLVGYIFAADSSKAAPLSAGRFSCRKSILRVGRRL